jgi:AcrR family transcriptional regulator
MPRRPRQNGNSSRRALLARAMALTAREGPSSATIGVLAGALGMSKSGVFALFGSKEALDLAVVDAAGDHFSQTITAPAHSARRGVARLAALVEGWLGDVEAASPALAVLGLDPRGLTPSLRLRLGEWRTGWRRTLESEVAEARRAGELAAGTDATQAAFEIDALLAAAARDAEAGDARAGAAARRAIEIRLQQLAAGR